MFTHFGLFRRYTKFTIFSLIACFTVLVLIYSCSKGGGGSGTAGECTNTNTAQLSPDEKGVAYIKPCGSGNGSSWNQAAGKEALRNIDKLPSSVKALWIASGVYTPSNSEGASSKNSAFKLRNNLVVYGGFAGNEKNLTDRDIKAHPVIFCGRLDHNDGVCEGGSVRTYRVFNAENVNASAILDGVSIAGADSSFNPTVGKGGGMYVQNASPSLRNVQFVGNSAIYGGAIYIDSVSASKSNPEPMIFDKVSFKDNASLYGGAIYNTVNGVLLLRNSTFNDNVAAETGGAIHNLGKIHLKVAELTKNKASHGGAIYDGGSLLAHHSTFDGNVAVEGAGIYNQSENPNAVVNALFINNSAKSGPSIFNNGSYSLVLNSILWDGVNAVGGNAADTYYYTLTQGSTSQAPDSKGNIKSAESFSSIFDASTRLKSFTSYYPSRGLPVNKGARIWANKSGNLYFFYPQQTSTVENLVGSNYARFSPNGKSWNITNNQTLPGGSVELTAADVRGLKRDLADSKPDLGPYEQDAANKYFLDPSLFGYETFNNEGLSVSPNGGVYFKQKDLLITPKETISVGLFFADPKDSLTKEKWRVSYSQFLDDLVPYDPNRIKGVLYSEAADACAQGWQNLKESVYNGVLAKARGRFNEQRGVCEIYDEKGALATYFAIRASTGEPYQGTHILTNDDGRLLLFEKSDTTPGSFFTKAQTWAVLSPKKDEANLWAALLEVNTGWTMEGLGVNLGFDDVNHLVRFADSTRSSVSLKYSYIAGNDPKMQAYSSSLGLQPVQQLDLESTSLDQDGKTFKERLKILRAADNRVVMVESLEPPVVHDQPLAYNPNSSKKNQEISKLYFHYDAQGIVDYVTPFNKVDGDAQTAGDPLKYSILSFSYNEKNRLTVYANLLETMAFSYDGQNRPAFLQTMMANLQEQYVYRENQLIQQEATSQKLTQAMTFSFENDQQRLQTWDVNTPNGVVRTKISYDAQGWPTAGQVPAASSLSDLASNLFAPSASTAFQPQDLTALNPYSKYPELAELRGQILNAIQTNNPNPRYYHFNCAGYRASVALNYKLNPPVRYNPEIQNAMDNCEASDGRTIQAFSDPSFVPSKVFPTSIDVAQNYVIRTDSYATCSHKDWRPQCLEYTYHYTDIYSDFSFTGAKLFVEGEPNTAYLNDHYARQHTPTSLTDSASPLPSNIKNKTIYYPPFETYVKEIKYKVCAQTQAPFVPWNCTTDPDLVIEKPINICSPNTYVFFWEGFNDLSSSNGPVMNFYLKFQNLCPNDRTRLDRMPLPFRAEDIDVAAIDRIPPHSKIIFIGHSWGGHAAIINSIRHAKNRPSLLFTIDPVVSPYPVTKNQFGDMAGNLLAWVVLPFFSTTYLVTDLLGIDKSNITSSGLTTPYWVNWWYNVRATVKGNNGDKNPIRWVLHKVKIEAFGFSYTLFSYDHPELTGWKWGDLVAFVGGKYYDYPNGKANTHLKKAVNHDHFCGMFNAVWNQAIESKFIDATATYIRPNRTDDATSEKPTDSPCHGL